MTSPDDATASEFVARLEAIASKDEVEKVARFFHGDGADGGAATRVLGVPIGKVFPVAKEFTEVSLDEIEMLLESPYYEVRMGAVSIMDFQARAKSTEPAHREALFDLYLRRHDRIDNWDLVDRAAPHVVGGWLFDRPRDVLYELAGSANPWERRTAIVSTWYFIRSGQLEDTFRIAEILLHDEHELVRKATGSWLREAGKRDPDRLVRFLEKHAATMPRTTLRYAVGKLEKHVRARLMRMKAG